MIEYLKRTLLCVSAISALLGCVAKAQAEDKSVSSAAAADASGSGQDSGWDYQTVTSALDGSVRYRAMLSARAAPGESTGSSFQPLLVVRCTPSNDGLVVFVVWPKFMGLGDATIAYRVDQDPVQTQSWGSSSDGRSTGLFLNQSAARSLIQRLGSAQSFVVQASPYQSAPVEAAFDLGPVAKMVAPALKGCP